MRGPLVAAVGVGLIALGAIGGVMLSRRPAVPASAVTTPAVDSTMTTPARGGGEMPANGVHGDAGASMAGSRGTGNPEPVVTLTPEMITRAGIRTTPAATGAATSRIHLPGVVQPNAYKAIAVTSLVSGRVTRVGAELGQRVMAGESMATIYSPELADAQTAFIAARAEHTAHDQQQARTQRLYAIGAASRQELERLEAEKSEMDAKVETARARLVLLGIPEERTQRLASPADVVTTFEVRAPIAGVITRRSVNAGLNIDLSTELFTVTDLSTVWVVADLYERDFAGVGVGSAATVTTPAYPGTNLRGRVEYIDPQVEADTRTAKLRVEVPNAGTRLRLGMYVDVAVEGRAARPVVRVPKSAIQTIGAESVVYVAEAGQPGRFHQRRVTTGDIGDGAGGDPGGDPGGGPGSGPGGGLDSGMVAILDGLSQGDLVVTAGAFFLRAELERTAPNNAGAAGPGEVGFRPSTP